MTMAALNILSQPWPPLSFSNNNSYLIKCNTSVINNKLHSLPHSYHYSVLSSLYGTNRPNPSSKLSPIPTQLSKSGNFSIFCFNFILLNAFTLLTITMTLILVVTYISLCFWLLRKSQNFDHNKKKKGNT